MKRYTNDNEMTNQSRYGFSRVRTDICMEIRERKFVNNSLQASTHGYRSLKTHWKSSRESLRCFTRVHCCTLPLPLSPGSDDLTYSRIDDVEDNSSLRRGLPVAHLVYGIPQTINSANYVYFCALRELEGLGHADLFKVFYGSRLIEMTNVDELINLHRGQGMDLFWRDTLICPTEQEYVEMVKNKTSGLLRLAVKLMEGYSLSSTYIPQIIQN